MKPKKNPASNGGNAIVGYINEVREELGHVTWPTKAETVRLTVMVLAVSVIVGAYLGGLDYLFTYLLGILI